MATYTVQGSQAATAATQSLSGKTTSAAKGLQDQFLHLLAAELKYQDPLSPMENKDFVSQVAQLSAVESISAMKESQEKLMAASLVGKHVCFENDGVELAGSVWGVKLRDGVALLIDDKEVTLDKVIAVG